MVICAWCNKILQKDKKGIKKGTVSHGICDKCAKELKEELKTMEDTDKGNRIRK